jgi:acyl-CoA reductase-like NAD-dependent aldehyde dehydrogenase
MLNLPILRRGEPYTSMDVDEVVHFATGEPIARVSRANAGMLQRDMRHAARARALLREIPIDELIARAGRAGELYMNGKLAMGDGVQTPDDFVHAQSASTGLPERMCRANMKKNAFVLAEMRSILTSLTRGLAFDTLARGHGEERGVAVSYQANSPVLGLVLPSNSPGVHTLWMPIIPMQVGLVLKPGPQEPWTPYRMAAAFVEAGVPKEAISIYPGGADVGAAVLDSCDRSLIFGGTPTVDRYRGNPRVQAHGPGFSKILLGDDEVDNWERYLDVMVESVFLNSGRGCINCSTIWASRHTREIAEALAQRLAPVQPLPPSDPEASLAAFTVPGVAEAISQAIDADLKAPGVTDMTSAHRDGRRVVTRGPADYLLPTVLHSAAPDAPVVAREYMFPFVTVVQCQESRMIDTIGPMLVCTAITGRESLVRQLLDAVHIDRLNIGPVPTTRLNWLQPHEGNIVEFLFRARAFQTAPIVDEPQRHTDAATISTAGAISHTGAIPNRAATSKSEATSS